jgi:hypothetical protein
MNIYSNDNALIWAVHIILIVAFHMITTKASNSIEKICFHIQFRGDGYCFPMFKGIVVSIKTTKSIGFP